MTRKLLREDGENLAVRTFLAAYGSVDIEQTIGGMAAHLKFSGYPYWPAWVREDCMSHLTKGGAQEWLRHLFALENKSHAKVGAGEVEVMSKLLTVRMTDGSLWGVPVEIIAISRATHYASEYNSVEESLLKDTGPLFETDDYSIEDWAENNMNWSDVAAHAVMLEPQRSSDYQVGWVNGKKEVINK